MLTSFDPDAEVKSAESLLPSGIYWAERQQLLSDIIFFRTAGVLRAMIEDVNPNSDPAAAILNTIPLLYFGDAKVAAVLQSLYPERQMMINNEQAVNNRSAVYLICHNLPFEQQDALYRRLLIKAALLELTPTAGTFSAPTGTMRIIPWGSPISAKTFLYVPVNAGYRDYDSSNLRKLMRYHNSIRTDRKGSESSPPELLNDWDSRAEAEILILCGLPLSTSEKLSTRLPGRTLVDRRKGAIKRRWVNNETAQQYDNILNPPFVIDEYQVGDDFISVVDDGVLPGGTKQRALGLLMLRHSQAEFVYGSVEWGYGQIAVAYAAQVVGRLATVYVGQQNNGKPTILTAEAAKYGATIVPTAIGWSNYGKAAEAYVTKDPAYRYLLPFGFDDDEFTELLISQLTAVLPLQLKMTPPLRLWLVVGSGTLLRALYKIFPTTKMMAVIVGKAPDLDLPAFANESARTEWFDHNKQQRFVDAVPSELLPPYLSVHNYDAKVWQYVLDHGQDGDFVWNVGKQP